jgi:hypothetical protein
MPRDTIVQSGGAPSSPVSPSLWVDLDTPQPMLSPSDPVFASTAARDAAWPNPYVGALCVTTDTGSLWQYFATTGWYRPFGVLGFAELTSAQGSITNTLVDVTSLSITITVPAGRRVKFTAQAMLQSTVAGDYGRFDLTSSDGSITYQAHQMQLGGSSIGMSFSKSQLPGAGTFTYKLRVGRTAGTGTLTVSASTVSPAQLLCEDIGPA